MLLTYQGRVQMFNALSIHTIDFDSLPFLPSFLHSIHTHYSVSSSWGSSTSGSREFTTFLFSDVISHGQMQLFPWPYSIPAFEKLL